MDVGTLFLMASLIGFHKARRAGYGKLGLTGFLISFVGLSTILVGNVIELDR